MSGAQRLLARYRRPQFGGICGRDSLRTCFLFLDSEKGEPEIIIVRIMTVSLVVFRLSK